MKPRARGSLLIRVSSRQRMCDPMCELLKSLVIYVNEIIKRAYDELKQIIITECRFTLAAHAQLISVINFE